MRGRWKVMEDNREAGLYVNLIVATSQMAAPPCCHGDCDDVVLKLADLRVTASETRGSSCATRAFFSYFDDLCDILI